MSEPVPAPATHAAGCLLLFTKPAVPGRVKTRLIGALTPAEAAALHEAFLADLVARLGRSTRFSLRLAWARSEERRVGKECRWRGAAWRSGAARRASERA